MGQYYKPANLKTREWLYSHDYENGLKLMEHSFIDNKFVGAVENLLIPGGAWYKCPLLWAGDYADGERLWSKGYRNIYHLLSDRKKLQPEKTKLPKAFRYIVNHTKKCYMDRNAVKGFAWPGSDKLWKINPLPLLTCEGNGRGGGDYNGKRMPLVGRWARDIISIEKKPPANFEELDGTFEEKQ